MPVRIKVRCARVSYSTHPQMPCAATTVVSLHPETLGEDRSTTAKCTFEKTSTLLPDPVVTTATKDAKNIQDDGAATFVVDLRLSSPDLGDLEKKPGEPHTDDHHFSLSPPSDALCPLRVVVAAGSGVSVVETVRTWSTVLVAVMAG